MDKHGMGIVYVEIGVLNSEDGENSIFLVFIALNLINKLQF